MDDDHEVATATMRVNVYAEALRPIRDKDGSPRVIFHHKQVPGLDFEHYAVRVFIGPRIIHSDQGNGKKDDDTAAVTFWYSDENQRCLLVEMFKRALEVLEAPGAKY
jgi:hypothetical protein